MHINLDGHIVMNLAEVKVIQDSMNNDMWGSAGWDCQGGDPSGFKQILLDQLEALILTRDVEGYDPYSS